MAKKLKENQSKIVVAEKVTPIKKTKIKVVGIGGGGGNIVAELAGLVKKATFLVANTDLQALKEIPKKVESFPFGQNFTQGLGTGLNPEIAELASRKEKEKIEKIFKDQDLIIFVSCLGGGTGSGATPVFAKICQNLGKLSYGIFTLPFRFEGEKKMEIAKRTLEILRAKLNTLTIFPNEKIFQVVDKNTPLKEAFSAINKSLAQSLQGFIETIYQPGLINIDFADLKTMLLDWRGRLAYLNSVSLSRKEGAAKEIVEKVLASPFYPYGIRGAKGILFNIVGHPELSLQEVSQISKTISENADSEAKIVFGISPTKKTQNIIKLTIFANGLSFPKEYSLKRESRAIKKQPAEKPKKEKETDVKGESGDKKIEETKELKEKKTKIKKAEKKEKIFSEIKNSESKKVTPETKIEIKVRKNALQLKKEIEEEEKEILEKEKFWETPAFLRRQLGHHSLSSFHQKKVEGK